jgi:hypothetical protein
LDPLLFIWCWSSLLCSCSIWSWSRFRDFKSIAANYNSLGSREWQIGSEPKWFGMASSDSLFSNTRPSSFQASSPSIM